MVGIDSARQDAVLSADVGCHADDFAHHTASAHDANRSQGYVRNTDVSACHKQVIDVAGIQAAIWNGVWRDGCRLAVGCEWRLVKSRYMFGIMQVDAPGGCEGGIIVCHMVYDVLFSENDIAH